MDFLTWKTSEWLSNLEILFLKSIFTQNFLNIKGKKIAGVRLSIQKKFFLDHPSAGAQKP